MRKPLPSVVVGFVLLATVVLPPLVFMALGASSGAAGVLLVSGLYIFLLVAFAALSPLQSLGRGPFFIALVVAIVFTQGLLSFSINSEFDFGRFLKSEVLLIISFLGAFSLTQLTLRLPSSHADFAVKVVFYALLLSGLAGIFEYSPFSGEGDA